MDLSSNSYCPQTPPLLSACPATPPRPNVLKSNPSSPIPVEDSSNEDRVSNTSENADNRSSPPPNCAICLYKCTNKCFTDSCLHQFCFTCLLQWSKVKPECPLCKQSFKSIIHNVRSNYDYEEYQVRPAIAALAEPLLVSSYHIPHSEGQRFQFRTTFNLQRQDEMALQNYFLDHTLTNNFVLSPNPFYELSLPRPRPTFTRRVRHRNLGNNGDFRSVVYRNDLWAIPLPDLTGRFRECSSTFYRNNPAQIHRLFPWLDRELKVLLNQNQPHINYVTSVIADLIPTHDITSTEFRSAIESYFTNNTEHFIHEFYQFARSPYDMVGYDNDVQYVSHEYHLESQPRVASSNSDTDDSDVRIISPDIRNSSNSNNEVIYVNDESTSVVLTSESAGLDLTYPRNGLSLVSSDDDSDACVITGVLKPPQDRTPEMIVLDSDVISVGSEDTPLSSSSDELFNPEIDMPSTSKVSRPKRYKSPVLLDKVKQSSNDSDSESNLPLIAHQKRMSEILLKRFQWTDKKNDFSDSTDSDEDKCVRKKYNFRKGKKLLRKTGKRCSTRKCIPKKRKLSSSSDSRESCSENSNKERSRKLKSVVIKKIDDSQSLSKGSFENSGIFSETVENLNYMVGSSYYNHAVNTSFGYNSTQPGPSFLESTTDNLSVQEH